MKSSQEVTATKPPVETNILGDDVYLVEMTDRLQRLRSLMGEKETRKGRPKRWRNRISA